MSTLFQFINVMEKLHFNYSYKNIPIPSERNYKLQLMEKTHFYNEKKDVKENKTNTIPEVYGLKSLICPPQVKELIQFESDLLDMIVFRNFPKNKKPFSKEIERGHKHYT